MKNFSTFRLVFFCSLLCSMGCEHNSCKQFADFNTMRSWLWQSFESAEVSLLKSNYKNRILSGDAKADPNELIFNSCAFDETVYINKKPISVRYWIQNGNRFLEIKEQLKDVGEFVEMNTANDSLHLFLNPSLGEKISFVVHRGNPTMYLVELGRDTSLVTLKSYNTYHKLFRWICSDNLNTTLPNHEFGLGSGFRHGFLLPLSVIGKFTGAGNYVFGAWANTSGWYWLGLYFGCMVWIMIIWFRKD